ncbi:hypothetical protein [Nitratireductor thuwali]|uniref:hypothetical protein n=1 Tax=Nitratireductor thuwali TaxID=2267699 RepID=UPI0030CE33AC
MPHDPTSDTPRSSRTLNAASSIFDQCKQPILIVEHALIAFEVTVLDAVLEELYLEPCANHMDRDHDGIIAKVLEAIPDFPTIEKVQEQKQIIETAELHLILPFSIVVSVEQF